MNNLTEQEKKFADAFVYLFFHAPALMPGMKEDAADNFARALSEKANIKQYIDSEIERFRGILSDDQSMNLWKHISEFKPGELTNDLLGGGCIISH